MTVGLASISFAGGKDGKDCCKGKNTKECKKGEKDCKKGKKCCKGKEGATDKAIM
ncbi:MAG: hypothetical protein SGJ04_08180 [Bacteroidota bacterium]|nr:hypothetical protein [Bacteroidota bacterium]